jgi:hypothetical protein
LIHLEFGIAMAVTITRLADNSSSTGLCCSGEKYFLRGEGAASGFQLTLFLSLQLYTHPVPNCKRRKNVFPVLTYSFRFRGLGNETLTGALWSFEGYHKIPVPPSIVRSSLCSWNDQYRREF